MCGAMVCMLTVVTATLAQPEPSPAPVTWELKFDPTPPMRISVDLGKGPQTFWYMLYTVTNNTGQDIDFHPEIVRVNEIETEATAEQAASQPAAAPTITVDPAIVGVHPAVFKKIQETHKRTHPFLKQPVDAIGKLLQGQDNALTSVAVFPDLDPRVSKFTIYVTGLSGEQTTKPNPRYDPKKAGGDAKKPDEKSGAAEARFFVLRKTLAIPYTLPGDAKTRRTAEPKLGKMGWVMR